MELLRLLRRTINCIGYAGDVDSPTSIEALFTACLLFMAEFAALLLRAALPRR